MTSHTVIRRTTH